MKNFKGSIILIISMIVGFLLGIILKENAQNLLVFGNLFINLLSTVIVPIIIVSITLAIAKIKPNKTLSLLKKIFIVFILMSLIAVLVGIVSTKAYRFVSQDNTIQLNESEKENTSDNNIIDKMVNMISVDDFQKLLSKDNMIAIIVFSIILGIAINITKERKDTIISLLENLEAVLNNILKIIMYYAPIGICCYFASMIGSLGAMIAIDYVKVFIYYLIISILFAVIIYSIIVKLCGKSVKKFWLESIPLILCSISTCSSAACLPINIKCTSKMGIKNEVSKTTISLGTSFHKDGSVIDSVFKIMFLVYLFNSNVSIFSIVIVSLIATLLITAVPVGGGTISELLILTLLGFPIGALPILTIIATITDAPATLLNTLGDTAASIWVDKLTKKDAI